MTPTSRAALLDRLHQQVDQHPPAVHVEIPRFAPDGRQQISAIAAEIHGDLSVGTAVMMVGGHACRCLAITCRGRLDGVVVDARAFVVDDGLADSAGGVA